jgi:hypothetical protein
MAILKKLISPIAIGIAFVSCYHVDTFEVGLFDITSIAVNMRNVPAEKGQTEMMLPIAKSHVLLQPVWLTGALDLAMVITPAKNCVFELDEFKVETPNLTNREPNSSSDSLIPFYYIQMPDGITRMTLPTRIQSKLRIGVINDRHADDSSKSLVKFTLRLRDSYEVHSIEMSGYRKIGK